jgi:6-pyruvoyltetrahydropterin/6-carboxytetrahydropterin synthase
MIMYKISKEFEFSYGHRVWNQMLSRGAVCKCRWLHGHNGVLRIELGGNTLKNDMVMDYNELSFVKHFVDDFMDHKMILDRNDPMLELLFSMKKEHFRIDSEQFGFATLDWDKRVVIPDELKELYESVVLIDCVPTSENICKLLFDGFLAEGLPVSKVSFKETDKTEASYEGV